MGLLNNEYMRVRVLILVVILFLSIIPSVSAHEYKKEVLGDSVQASDITVPTIAAGPGILLPDSPLYFLDKSIQNIKLFLISDPGKKAELHDLIARERLAELRIMMAKNNKQAIARVLSELSSEQAKSASLLKIAASEGKDVKKLATSLNISLKEQRKFLDVISDQSTGALKLQIKAAKEDLKLAKLDIEDELSEDELIREIKETMEEELEESVTETEDSATGLSNSINVLTRLASVAAAKDQDNRVVALKLAIENKNDALRKQEELKLINEKKRQEKLYVLRQETIEQARETVQAAQITARRFEATKQAQQEMFEPTRTPLNF